MGLKDPEIIHKSLAEANIVGQIHNVSGFSSSFSITLKRSCQMRDESGFL